MNTWESIRVAVNMLRLHKLRAFLTMLGVIIGVMSVTMVIMISSGFKHYLTYQFEKLGANTIMIMYDPSQGRHGMGVGRIDGLKPEDGDYIVDHCSSVGLVSSILQLPQQKLVFGTKNITTSRVMATDEKQAQLSSVPILEGRGLIKADLDGRRNICVIGEEIRDTLFPHQDAIGQYVTFNGITLQVVGIMSKIEILGQDTGKDVWLPITTAQQKWVGGRNVSYLTALPKDGYTVDETLNDIWASLMLKSNNRVVYRIISRQQIIGVFGSIVGIAGIVLSGVAGLSLLVGGIGIMNIMLVSVTERTREIGLRKALGARRNAILAQFLTEAAILSVIGGIIGMFVAFTFGLGITLLTVANKWPDSGGLQMPFPFLGAVFTIAFSAGIGIVFGLYPAARASSLSPIEALRTE